MSGYPYGGNPQYPPPQGMIYPQMYNQVNAPPPGQAPPPSQLSYPVPGQNPQYYQPGFPYGQQPTAMQYPNVNAAPANPPVGFGFPTVSPTPAFTPVIEWVPSNPRDAQYTLGDRAVVGGYEGYDGSPLWVIRARFEGDLIPGKLAVKHHAAYVAWGGKENPVHQIEVCCARPEKIRWVNSQHGVLPPNAIVAGNTSSGETLYIGRAKEQGSLTPGKVHPSHKVVYISFGGQEIPHQMYEVLCTV